MKCGGLVILDPQLLVECSYNTSKAATEVLVDSILGGTNINYIAHKGCVCRESADRWEKRDFLETAVLTRWKELADGAVLNRLRQATDNGSLAHDYSLLPQ